MDDASRVNKILGRKDGGRVPDTNIHISVNAAKPAPDAGAGLGALAAAAQAANPPPPPMPAAPPPDMSAGAPPLSIGGGGPGSGPGPIAMKRGGRADGGRLTKAEGTSKRMMPKGQDETDGDYVSQRRARGGGVRQLGPTSGGAGGGLGRIEKAADERKSKK